MASAFGSGWSDNIAGHTKVMAAYTSRLDNVIAYVSPTFAGTTIYAQYAMGGDDGGDENKTNTDRYAALGAKWAGGPFEVGALVDWTNKSNAVLKIGTTTLGSNDYTIEDASRSTSRVPTTAASRRPSSPCSTSRMPRCCWDSRHDHGPR